MTRVAEKTRSNEPVLAALCEGGITPVQAEALCDARVPDEVRAELVTAAAAEDTDTTRRRIQQAETDHSSETPMERFGRQRQMRMSRPSRRALSVGQLFTSVGAIRRGCLR